jgi:uncharacterized protein YjbI with pentapeptide repeats
MLTAMSKPPTAPYPPDPDDADDAPAPTEPGDLLDVTVADADWANAAPPRSIRAHRTELRRCRLTGAELAQAQLTDVTFTECRLDLLGLRHATLERVVFRDCPMGECDLADATLKDVLFERCDLRRATFSGVAIQRVELRGCELGELRGTEGLRGARMPWSDLLENAAVFAAALGIELVE